MDPDALQSPQSAGNWFSLYKLPLILAAVSGGCLVLALVLFVKSVQNVNPIRFSSENTVASLSGQAKSAEEIVVDVSGAVVKPGVYRLPIGSRVEDALIAAGGLSDKVDSEFVSKILNRAAVLINGGKLYFPIKGSNDASYNNSERKVMGVTSHNINKETIREGESQNGGLISINLASQSLLESLSGVGPVTATKIIDNRPYQTLDDLLIRKIISKSLFDKLKDSLSL